MNDVAVVFGFVFFLVIFLGWPLLMVNTYGKASGIEWSADEAIKPEADQSKEWGIELLKARHRAQIADAERVKP